MMVMSAVPELGDFIQMAHMRSLDIEGIGVAFISFFQINPILPQPFLRVDFSVSLLSVLTSAVKAGLILHNQSAS